MPAPHANVPTPDSWLHSGFQLPDNPALEATGDTATYVKDLAWVSTPGVGLASSQDLTGL